MEKWKPGEVSPKAGSYKVADESGKKVNIAEVDKGQRFPPTQSSKHHYEK